MKSLLATLAELKVNKVDGAALSNRMLALVEDRLRTADNDHLVAEVINCTAACIDVAASVVALLTTEQRAVVVRAIAAEFPAKVERYSARIHSGEFDRNREADR